MAAKTDFSKLGSQELVQAFNKMVGSAALDPKVWRPVKRFANRETGLRRARALEDFLSKEKDVTEQAQEQATNGKGKGRAAPAPAAGEARPPTLHQLTEQYNELLADAQKHKLELPPWAKFHSSDFADKVGANKQIVRLTEAIAEARKPKSAKASAEKGAASNPPAA